jgi:EAL and modified HD-GYP domain-containing signal transduction protein
MLNRQMTEIVAELPLDDDTRHALCGRPGVKRSLLECVIAYERGEWQPCEAHAKAAGIDPAALPSASAEALRWAHELRTAAKFGQPN